MAIYHVSKAKVLLGTQKVKKGYLGTQQIYSSGNVVTYMVDGAVYETIELDEGSDVLNAVSNPSKSYYTFNGWSLISGGEKVNSLFMGDDPITLHALWNVVPFYPILNGIPQSGKYTSASRILWGSGHYAEKTYPDSTDSVATDLYGYYCVAISQGATVGATISFNTRGCSKINVTVRTPYFDKNYGGDIGKFYVTTNTGAVLLNEKNYTEHVYATKTINVSGYSSITVQYTSSNGGNDMTLGAGIKSIYCY